MKYSLLDKPLFNFLAKNHFNFTCKDFIKIVFFFLIIIAISCNKEMVGTSIEYQMDPISNTTVKITYTDAPASDVVIDDWEKFKTGSKKIVVTKKPFSAKIAIESNNRLNTKVSFNLIILVDNQIKKLVKGDVPPQVLNHVTEAKFLVE